MSDDKTQDSTQPAEASGLPAEDGSSPAATGSRAAIESSVPAIKVRANNEDEVIAAFREYQKMVKAADDDEAKALAAAKSARERRIVIEAHVNELRNRQLTPGGKVYGDMVARLIKRVPPSKAAKAG